MQKESILTIAIPTYNRSKELAITLSHLFKQDGSRVRILVSDDGSTDNTERTVKKFQKKYKNLFYNRNMVNQGYSTNVYKLYKLSKTKFIWFLCDDDTVLPGAVAKILSAIDKYNPTIATFNYTWLDPYGRRLKAYNEEDILYTDKSELSDYQSLMRLGFLSAIVVKKVSRLTFANTFDSNKNIFFQITLGLGLLTKRFRLLESNAVILHRNVGYNYGEFFKSYMIDHLDAIYAVRHDFNNHKFIQWSKRQFPSTVMLYFSQKLGLFDYRGSLSMTTKKKLKKYYGGLSHIAINLPVIKHLVPTILIQYVYLGILIRIHGYKKAKLIYMRNLNRAQKDRRTSGFLGNV